MNTSRSGRLRIAWPGAFCLSWAISASLVGCPSPAPQPDPAVPTATPPPPTAPSPAAEVTIAIVGTSDLHGYVEPRQLQVRGSDGQPHTVLRGGLPLLAGYLDNLRAQKPVLLLDGGDMFQGTMVSNMGEGQAVVDAYNVIGYHAAAIGNHEFDFGPAGPRSVPKLGSSDDPNGALKARAAAARYPFLSANLMDRNTGQPVAWPNVYPSRIVELTSPHGPLRIGVIGALTEDTPRTTNVLNLRDVTIAPIVPAVRAEAAKLQAQGVDAVVLTIHEGANCYSFSDPHDTSSCKNSDEHIFRVIDQLQDSVDAVVAGHTHAGVAHYAGRVPIIQAFSYGIAFGRLDLTFSRRAAPPPLSPAASASPSAPATIAPTWQVDRSRTRVFPPTEVCSVALPDMATLPQPAGQVGVALAEVAAAPSSGSGSGSSDTPQAAPTATQPPIPTMIRVPLSRCDARVLEGRPLPPADYEGRPVVASTAVTEALRPHVDRASARATQPLGVTLPSRVRRNFRSESALGQLLADLMRSGASRVLGNSVDLAVQNGGGVRNDLPAGALTYTSLFEVMPFDNRLAIVRLTGSQLRELFRRNAVAGHGILVPSGIRVLAQCNGATLDVQIQRDNGEPLQPDRLYTVAASDFLATGGDNFGGLVPTQEQQATSNVVTMYDDVVLRDLMVEELQRYRGPLLSGNLQPARLQYPSPRPVRCPLTDKAPAPAPSTH